VLCYSFLYYAINQFVKFVVILEVFLNVMYHVHILSMNSIMIVITSTFLIYSFMQFNSQNSSISSQVAIGMGVQGPGIPSAFSSQLQSHESQVLEQCNDHAFILST
jgi:hypothetical protein